MTTRQKIADSIRVASFSRPATEDTILRVERELGVIFPNQIRRIYRECDGICGANGTRLLWPLIGDNNVLGFNEFLREEEYAPSWCRSAIFFGHDGVSGTIGRFWGVRMADPEEIIEWGFQYGEEVNLCGKDIILVWKLWQEKIDKITNYFNAE